MTVKMCCGKLSMSCPAELCFVCVCVCLLTLRRCCREGLCMQQIQSTLVLLVFLLHSRSDFLGTTTFLVVQLATFGQQTGSSGFGRGLDHGVQTRTLLLTARVLLKDVQQRWIVITYGQREVFQREQARRCYKSL